MSRIGIKQGLLGQNIARLVVNGQIHLYVAPERQKLMIVAEKVGDSKAVMGILQVI